MNPKMIQFYYNPNHMMVNLFDQVANECIDNLKKKVSTPQEPDITAALATDFPNQINKFYHFTHCRFGGCFIHQSPKVHIFDYYGTTANCEAGDLLVLCRRKEDEKELFNATLFQLKMHAPKTSTVPIVSNVIHTINNENELKQLHLYQNWPVFKMGKNIKKEKSQRFITLEPKYDIYPKTATPGAQYLLVNKKNHVLSPTMPARKMQLNLFYTWGDFLINFINWQTGRPILQEDEANNDEWSKFIWEIVNRCRNNVFNRRRINYVDKSRINGEFFKLMLEQGHTTDINGFDDKLRKNVQYPENKESFSILFIDVNENIIER